MAHRESLHVVWRPLTPIDFGALQELLQEVAVTDKNDDWHVGGDLVSRQLSFDDYDLENGTLVGFDNDTMVAGGSVRFLEGNGRDRSMFYMGIVRPGYREQGLELQLLSWASDTANVLHRQRYGQPPRDLRTDCRPTDLHMIKLYRQCGFEPIRTYSWMTRPLSGPITSSNPPDGIEIVPYSNELDEEARELKNDAFAENWAAQHVTRELWQRIVAKEPEFQPQLSFAAVATPHNTMVGLVITSDLGAQDATPGPRQATVMYIATLRQIGRAHV